MIKMKSSWKKGASAVEYMALIAMVLGAFIVFDKYIVRMFWGQWQKAGDAFGHGKQYDPRSFGTAGDGGGTLRCIFIYDDPDDLTSSNGKWARQPCYDDCLLGGDTSAQCATQCKDNTYCNDS